MSKNLLSMPFCAATEIDEPAIACERKDYRPTPSWFAELFVEVMLGELGTDDMILEPCAGDGRLLAAIPPDIRAVGIEIESELAQIARERSGRPVITGNCLTAPWPDGLTAIVSNPPFKQEMVDRLLARAHSRLGEGGRVALLLPAWFFQTAAHVRDVTANWSVSVNCIPRDIFVGFDRPLVSALFTKEAQQRWVGVAFFGEVADVRDTSQAFQARLRAVRGQKSVWWQAVRAAIEELGGVAGLDEICKHAKVPTNSSCRFVRQKIRQTLYRYGTPAGELRWAA